MRLARLAVILSTAFLLGTLTIAVGLSFAQTSPELPGVQRYLPDQETPWQPDWRPEPDNPRTLYAERIVLRGQRCVISIDATGKSPGISVQDLKSGQRCVLYLDTQGEAAMGVSTPARRELAAGLFTGKGLGCVQLSDQGGVHVFSGRELGGRRFGDIQE
jgi:hypothetical protein